MNHKILVVNTGSTTTKFAVYENDTPLISHNISHDSEILNRFSSLNEQVEYRKGLIEESLEASGFDLHTLDIVMCRGAEIMYPKITNGAYEVNDDLYEALGRNDITKNHASRLSGLIGKHIADSIEKKAYIYDAVTAGELTEVSQVTGFKEIKRISMCHVLNSRAMAIKYSKSIGMPFESMRLVIAHLGGGCSVSVYQGGKIIESSGDDDGPFSPERSGSVPSLKLIELCYSGKYTEEEMIKKAKGKGGMYALLGTSDCRVVEEMIASGNEYAQLIFHALAYQNAKAIALNSIALKGQIDAIILTGGAAYSKALIDMITEYVRAIAPVVVMPGENEIEALAQGGARLLKGEEKAREYIWPSGFKHQTKEEEKCFQKK